MKHTSYLQSAFKVSLIMCHTAAICSVPSNGEVDCDTELYIKLKLYDPYYMSQGSGISENCNSGNGSGGLQSFAPLNCSKNISANATILSPCNIIYQCTTVLCDESYTGDDITYLCNVTSDPIMIDWVSIGGVDMMCERGLLAIMIISLFNSILNYVYSYV